MNLDKTQIDFVVQCVSSWIRKCDARYGRGPTSADADHSALLRRLLSGKPMLPEPPPLRHSYPDYKLAEGEPTEVMEIWERGPMEGDPDPVVVVDQHAEWEWGDKDAGILKYKPTGHLYRLTTETRTRKRIHGGRVDEIPYGAKVIQRIMVDEGGRP